MLARARRDLGRWARRHLQSRSSHCVRISMHGVKIERVHVCVSVAPKHASKGSFRGWLWFVRCLIFRKQHLMLLLPLLLMPSSADANGG